MLVEDLAGVKWGGCVKFKACCNIEAGILRLGLQEYSGAW